MLVGLTYDLRADYLALGYGEEETAEFDRPDTVSAIEATIRNLGHQTERIGHVWNLVERLSQGQRWDLVFNIAEGLNGLSREAQVPALLEAYAIPYTFSSPLVMGLSLHKALTKQVLREHGLPTPDFRLVESESDLDRLNLPFPLFAKPVAEGTGKGVNAQSIIRDPGQLEAVCGRLLREFRQPVLVERFLPGREFTVGVLGTGDKARTLGVMEVLLLDKAEKGVYSYQNKENSEELVTYRMVDDLEAKAAEAVALAAFKALGCRDAGRVDLRSDENGRPQFMEINPLPGLHPEHSDLPIICGLVGLPYLELIRTIVDSALERGREFEPPRWKREDRRPA